MTTGDTFKGEIDRAVRAFDVDDMDALDRLYREIEQRWGAYSARHIWYEAARQYEAAHAEDADQ